MLLRVWAVMLALVDRSYRRRLALEWRAAVAVAFVAAAGVVLGLLPRPIGDVWLLVLFGAIVVVAMVLLVLAFRRPVAAPPVMPRRFGYEEAARAGRRVRRGEPVDPPELQGAAIGQARRGLRLSHLMLGWWPVVGATWALRIGEPGFFGGFAYVGVALMLLGIGGLAWSGVAQGRLDRLEDAAASVAVPTISAEPGEEPWKLE